jgi:hypothetical protein
MALCTIRYGDGEEAAPNTAFTPPSESVQLTLLADDFARELTEQEVAFDNLTSSSVEDSDLG